MSKTIFHTDFDQVAAWRVQSWSACGATHTALRGELEHQDYNKKGDFLRIRVNTYVIAFVFVLVFDIFALKMPHVSENIACLHNFNVWYLQSTFFLWAPQCNRCGAYLSYNTPGTINKET